MLHAHPVRACPAQKLEGSKPETGSWPDRGLRPGVPFTGRVSHMLRKRVDWIQWLSMHVFQASEKVYRRKTYRTEIKQGCLRWRFKALLITGVIIRTAAAKSCWQVKLDKAVACYARYFVHSNSTVNVDYKRPTIVFFVGNFKSICEALWFKKKKVTCSFKVLLIVTLVKLV